MGPPSPIQDLSVKKNAIKDPNDPKDLNDLNDPNDPNDPNNLKNLCQSTKQTASTPRHSLSVYIIKVSTNRLCGDNAHGLSHLYEACYHRGLCNPALR